MKERERERERESKCVSRGGTEKGERESQAGYTLSAQEPDAGLNLTSCR